MEGERLWGNVLEQIEKEREKTQARVDRVRIQEDDCQARVDALHDQYLALGGNVIGELQKTIELQEESVHERQKHADDYVQTVRVFGLNPELSHTALAANQAVLSERRSQVQQQRDVQYSAVLTAESEKRDVERQAAEVDSALQKVKDRPGSNIPPQFQDFRSALAAEIDVAEITQPIVEQQQRLGMGIAGLIIKAG